MISNYIIYYLGIVGIAIIVYWIFFIYKNKIATNYIKTHIIAEFITGILLIISVISRTIEIIPIAIGMLIYASINIIGNYIDQRDNKMTIMLILNLIILIILILYLSS